MGDEQGAMTQAESACFPAGSSRTWSNAKHDYTITGSEQSFDQCFAQAQQALAKFNIDKPSEITNGDIFAFSHFFDKAVQSGLKATKEAVSKCNSLRRQLSQNLETIRRRAVLY